MLRVIQILLGHLKQHTWQYDAYLYKWISQRPSCYWTKSTWYQLEPRTKWFYFPWKTTKKTGGLLLWKREVPIRSIVEIFLFVLGNCSKQNRTNSCALQCSKKKLNQLHLDLVEKWLKTKLTQLVYTFK